METLFGNSLGITENRDSNEVSDYEALVRTKIDDAVDYEMSYLQWGRLENLRYYYGELPLAPGEDDDGNPVNKSTIVSTDVRDVIMSVLPTLVRIFMGSEFPVFYCANTKEDAEKAKNATRYAHYLFRNLSDGFLTLHSVFKDALTTKIGVVQTWTDSDYEVIEKTYMNLSQEQYKYLLFENKTAQPTVLESNPDGSIEKLVLRFEVPKPLIKSEAVPPEEFRISRYATTPATTDLIGRERMVSRSFLLKKGVPPEIIENFVQGDPILTDDRLLRNPALIDKYSQTDQVYYGEWYMRVDGDGDGIDELRYIQTLGDNHVIIADEPATRHKFAVFQVDPRPHTVVGDALTDLAKDIQRIKTGVSRAVMDNLVEVVNPKTVINELVTNVEDALNDEVGALIRTRGDPSNAVQFSRPQFVGGEAQEVIDYLDRLRASRTGITEASKGLDPKALQSTALSGVDAIISGAQERIELIALILANTGFKDLFTNILEEMSNSPNSVVEYQFSGQWYECMPSTFDAAMRCEVNPTLGKGSDMTRLQVLQMIYQQQKEIVAQYGIARNPAVGPVELMNTVTDMLAIVNIKDTTRYFKPMTPEVVAQIDQAPTEPTPEQLVAQAEMEKVKAAVVKAMSSVKQADRKLAFDYLKLKLEDDFRRDKMEVDAAVDTATFLKDTTAQIEPQATAAALNTPPAQTVQ